MAVPLWQQRLDNSRLRFPELAKKHVRTKDREEVGFDYKAFAEDVRKKNKASPDVFYGELLKEEPESGVAETAALAVGRPLLGAIKGMIPRADDILAGDELSRANAKAAKLKEEQAVKDADASGITRTELLNRRTAADEDARYESLKKRDPEAAERFKASIDAQRANEAASSAKLNPNTRSATDEVSQWYLNKQVGVASLLAEDDLKKARMAESLEKSPAARRIADNEGILEPGVTAAEYRRRAAAATDTQVDKRQAVTDLPRENADAGVFEQVGRALLRSSGDIAGSVGGAILTGGAGPVVASAVGGGIGGAATYGENVSENMATMTPEEARRVAARQTGASAVLGAVGNAVPFGRVGSAAIGGGTNVVDYAQTELQADRELTPEGALAAKAIGAISGAAMPNKSSVKAPTKADPVPSVPIEVAPIQTGDPAIDTGAADAAAAINIASRRMTLTEKMNQRSKDDSTSAKETEGNIPSQSAAPVASVVSTPQATTNVADLSANDLYNRRVLRTRNHRTVGNVSDVDTGQDLNVSTGGRDVVNPVGTVQRTGIDTNASKPLPLSQEIPSDVGNVSGDRVADTQNERAVRFGRDTTSAPDRAVATDNAGVVQPQRRAAPVADEVTLKAVEAAQKAEAKAAQRAQKKLAADTAKVDAVRFKEEYDAVRKELPDLTDKNAIAVEVRQRLDAKYKPADSVDSAPSNAAVERTPSVSEDVPATTIAGMPKMPAMASKSAVDGTSADGASMARMGDNVSAKTSDAPSSLPTIDAEEPEFKFDVDSEPAPRSRQAYKDTNEFVADVSSGLFNKEARQFKKMVADGKATVFHTMDELRRADPAMAERVSSAALRQTGNPNLAPTAWVSKDGRLYVNTSRVSKGTAKALIVHEVGSHLGIDARGLTGNYADAVTALASRGNKIAQMAMDNAKNVYGRAGPDVQRSEAVAKFLQEAYQKIRANAPLGRAGALYREIIGRLRLVYADAMKKFFGKEVTLSDNDIITAARQGRQLPSTSSKVNTAPKADGIKFDIVDEKSAAPVAKPTLTSRLSKNPVSRVGQRIKRGVKGDFVPEGKGDSAVYEGAVQVGNTRAAAGVIEKRLAQVLQSAAKEEGVSAERLRTALEKGSEGLPAKSKAAIDAIIRQNRANAKELVAQFNDMVEKGWLSTDSADVRRTQAIAANAGTYIRRTYDFFKSPAMRRRFLNQDKKNAAAKGVLSIMDKAVIGHRQSMTIPEGTLTPAQRKHYAELWGAEPSAKADTQQKIIDEVRAMSKEDFDEAIDGYFSLLLTSPDKVKVTEKNLQSIARNMSSLMEREQVPQWLKDLWGEQKDPFVNVIDTLSTQAELIAKNRFYMGLMRDSELLRKQPKEGYVEINNPALGPLHGRYMRPENMDMLNDVGTGTAQGLLAAGMLSKVLAQAKIFTVVYNSASAALSLASNVFLGAMNGRGVLAGGGIGNAGKAAKVSFMAAFDRSLAKASPEAVGTMVDAYKYGIFGDTVLNKEVAEEIKTWSKSGIEDSASAARATAAKDKVMGLLRGGTRLFSGTFTMSDAMPKLYYWLGNIEMYKKAFPDKSLEEVKKMAAEITIKGSVSFSRQPRLVKQINQRSPFTPFLTNTMEMIRSSFYHPALAAKHIKSGNPVLIQDGIVRLSTWMALIGSPLFVTAMNSKDEESFQKSLPPQAKGYGVIDAGVDEYGQTKYFDTRRANPMAPTASFFSALIAGDLEEAGASLLRNVSGTTPGAVELVKVTAALFQKANGTLSDTAYLQMEKDVSKLVDVYIPSTPRKLLQAGMGMIDADAGNKQQRDGTFDAGDFALSLVGMSPSAVNVVDGPLSAIAFAHRDFEDTRNATINNLKNQLAKRDYQMSAEEVETLVTDALQQDADAFKEYKDVFDAARKRNELSDADIIAKLKIAAPSVRKAFVGTPRSPGMLFTGYDPDALAKAWKDDLFAKVQERQTSTVIGQERRSRLQESKYTDEYKKMIEVAIDRALNTIKDNQEENE